MCQVLSWALARSPGRAAWQGRGCMFSGSGDWGIYGCINSLALPFVQNAIYPSSQPWVTGTGGTSLEGYNPEMNPHPGPPPRGTETVWNVDNLCSTQGPAPGSDNQGGPFWCGGGRWRRRLQPVLGPAVLPVRAGRQ